MSGFAIKFTRIVCDHPDCVSSFEGRGDFNHVRRLAQLEQWTYAIMPKKQGLAPVYDFCFKHPDEAKKRGLNLIDLVTPRAAT